MKSRRLASFARWTALILIVLELPLLGLTLLASGRDQEPLLRAMFALAAAGTGWYQSRIAVQPLREHRLRALVALACIAASLWCAAGALRLSL